ncbi:hypothetical protein DEM34_08090 [Spiribacter halobius]|uniref:Uncharacterized protein n=2 Tax=Sediminicurvatus halobius TaxID=2182432 RepID=A0A2U2N2Q1_9GAMM|nr:hypothetical protein DEM34_08090 [Spiribacter halobius]
MRVCDAAVRGALRRWQARSDPEDSGIDHLRLPDTYGFRLTADGSARDHWPTPDDALLSETLSRQTILRRGLASVIGTRPRLFGVRYSVIAVEGEEWLLLCPYAAAGTVAGACVVCVDQHLRTVR